MTIIKTTKKKQGERSPPPFLSAPLNMSYLILMTWFPLSPLLLQANIWDCISCGEKIISLSLQSLLSREYVLYTVFPISQPGNCSASCLLSSLAPRNGQGSIAIQSGFIECRFTQSSTSTYINILLTFEQYLREI